MSEKILFRSLLADDNISSIGQDPYGYEYKEAQMNPDDVQFEKDFSSLAFMFVQDRAQGLMPYMLGFEVVQRSSDGSKAVGIFGFKVGETYYYIPAFFMNNQVKGVDMILNKSTNMFMPLTEDWVDYITDKNSVELGKGSSGKVREDFDQPDFSFLQSPTVGPSSKSASAVEVAPCSFKKAWECMEQKIASSFDSDEEFQKSWVGFVTACTGNKYPFEKSASVSDGILGKYIREVGGPRAVGSLLKTASSSARRASSVLKFYDGVKSLYMDSFDPDCVLIKRAQESAPASASIVISDTPENEDEARDIVEDGFTIRDSRSDDKKSEVYSTDFEKRFSNPTTPGIYNVLMEDGSTKECSVLFKPRSGVSDINAIVILGDKFVSCRASDIITVGDMLKPASDIYDKASDIKDVSTNGKYVFVSKTGKFFGPYRVSHIVKEDGKRVQLRGYEDWDGNFYSSSDHDFSGHWNMDPFHTRSGLPSDGFSIGYIELANIDSDVAKFVNGRIIIPTNWGAIKLDSSYAEDGHNLSLGDSVSLENAMIKHAFHRLGVSSDGNDYFLRMDHGYNTEPMTYKKACVKLVTSVGLKPSDAKDILNDAHKNSKIERVVKMAQISSLPGVAMGYPDEQMSSSDPYTGMPVYDMPYEDLTYGQTLAPDAPGDNQIGENIGGDTSVQSNEMPEIDEESKALAQQAAQLGQKNVFDHAAIGGLSKVYDTAAVVDSYLPQFSQTLDRLGRILFLYYWKHDDFLGRYGSDDVVEMEDLLRGVFKSLGKLTLDLKSKAITNEDAEAAAM